MGFIKYFLVLLIVCTNVEAQQPPLKFQAFVKNSQGETYFSSDIYDNFLRVDGAIIEFYAAKKPNVVSYLDKVIDFTRFSNGNMAPLQLGEYVTNYRGSINPKAGEALGVNVKFGYCSSSLDETIDKVSITEFKTGNLIQDRISPNRTFSEVTGINIKFSKHCGTADSPAIASGYIILAPIDACDDQLQELSTQLENAQSLLRKEQANSLLLGNRLDLVKSDIISATTLVNLSKRYCNSNLCKRALANVQLKLAAALKR